MLMIQQYQTPVLMEIARTNDNADGHQAFDELVRRMMVDVNTLTRRHAEFWQYLAKLEDRLG